MKRVAFFAFGYGDISGGGGYERFFVDFFADYSRDHSTEYKLLLITDNPELFIKTKKFEGLENRIIRYTDFRFKFYYDLTDRVYLIKQCFRYFRTIYTQCVFLKILLKNKIDILHLPNYTKSYFFLISFISKVRFITGIKTTITIVDCRIPFKYNSSEEYFVNAGATSHTFQPLFEKVKLNGILTWYKSFVDFVKNNNLVSNFTFLYSVKSRYVNYNDDIIPISKKENSIIFAGRLDEQKRPIMFLEAIKIALETEPELFTNWKFELFGKGVLESAVKSFVDSNNLKEHVKISSSSEMKKIFKHSKCLVSIQEYENFPSLSVYEAMVTGNAIIAFNLGQTTDFVTDNENGLLVHEESKEALANAIINYVSNPHLHQRYFENNIRLCSQVHTYGNFKRQIEEFWNKL